MKQKTESLQVRFTEPEYHEGTKHIFLTREDLPDSWWQHSFIISKGRQNWAIAHRERNEGEYFNKAMYKGTLTECKKYMRQMVIRQKYEDRAREIAVINDLETMGLIDRETVGDRIGAVIKKYDFDFYGNRIKDNPIMAKMPIPPEDGLDKLIKNPNDFLQIIRITDTVDLKRCIKYLAGKFPEEYKNDSVKIVREIMANTAPYSYKNIEDGLKRAGCKTPEKTRQVLDQWAGFGSEQKVEKRAQDNGMGR